MAKEATVRETLPANLGALTVTPTQSEVFMCFRTFLLEVLPAGMEVFIFDGNRIPEPKGTEFLIMTPMRRDRLATNIDTSVDAKFTGSIVSSTLTVTDAIMGDVRIGARLFGVGVIPGTTIIGRLSGMGGEGTYVVSPPQDLQEQVLSSGWKELHESVQLTMQFDIHGKEATTCAGYAQMLSTILRDEFGVMRIAELNPHVAVLHADAPIQMHFANDQQQNEYRWILEAYFEVEQFVLVPQQFADSVVVGLIEVDTVYPP